MKKLMATFLSALLILPSSLAAAIHVPAVIDARQLTQRSYLDLLEMDRIPQFSAAELKTVEEQLKKEREAEQARLKKEEDRLEKESSTQAVRRTKRKGVARQC